MHMRGGIKALQRLPSIIPSLLHDYVDNRVAFAYMGLACSQFVLKGLGQRIVTKSAELPVSWILIA